MVTGGICFWELDISENIDATIPSNKSYNKIRPLLDKGKQSVIFSLAIDHTKSSTNQISNYADSLVSHLNQKIGDYIGDYQYSSDLDPDSFALFFYDHLHLFLDSNDYVEIEKRLNKESITTTMVANKASLMSPEGIALKDWIIRDPLHLMRYGYTKLNQNEISESFIQNDGLFISKDGSKLFLYAKLKYNPSNSKLNRELTQNLINFSADWNSRNPQNKLDYFGTFLIADANATQIASDIKVTVTIAVVCILLLLFYYYRNKVILLFFLMPGVFGVLFAIIGMYVWQGHISGIALGAGAVVLGIVVDYSFHFFSQYKQTKDAFATRKQILLPLVMSGATTIVAFLALTFAHSEVLHDFGLFTSLSLTGALIFVLLFLPTLLEPFDKSIQFPISNKLDEWFANIDLDSKSTSKWVVLLIIVITGILFHFTSDITFESDINKINYYPEELKQAELAHQNINPDLDKRVHFLVEGQDENEVARNNVELLNELGLLRDSMDIKEINSLGLFLLSNAEQQLKIDQWNSFWKDKITLVDHQINQTADSIGFKSATFSPFNSWLTSSRKTEDLYQFVKSSKSLSQLLLVSTDTTSKYSLITSVVLSKSKYSDFKLAIKDKNNAILVDGHGVMKMLTDAVKDDFNYLLIFASVLVLVAMLLVYGSIELTLVSFIPIAISWIWILGIAALLDFKFNFVNIIIVTFIFGLGDDFAIFITDGLQTKYKYGRKVLGHYKTGIVLSSVSTIIGTGVLFFAKHPAIKSIAGISVTGILTIVVVSFFVQPIIFNFFTTRRTNEGKPPVTFGGVLISIVGYTVFIVGSLLGVFIGFLIRLTPFKSTEWKKKMLHKMLKSLTGVMLDILVTTKKRYYHMERLDFTNPSVIIANHASFFDILAIARLNPNIIMLVNKWVYDSVLFGNAIRYADYLPTFESLDGNLDKAEKLVAKGYSIMVFPEGKRSVDGKIGRFHKGAFFLAEKLKLDITPIVLHGYAYTMPKYDYNLKNSYLNTYILPRIKNNDSSFGIGYKERTKSIGVYFKEEYAKVVDVCGAMDYQYIPLLHSYKFKGPILEWYFRIKWKFEKQHYENYYQMIGRGHKRVYDLGCGYGYLSYFLKLRNENLEVFGFDYDEDKIAVAQNSYLKSEGIEFQAADISTIKPENADAIIIADTLHYLIEKLQLKVLNQCNEGLIPGGLLLIRDGLSDVGDSHEWTKNSEKWSTKIIKFNKVKGDLHFFSKSFIENWAQQNNYQIEFDLQSEKSSNTLMILKKGK